MSAALRKILFYENILEFKENTQSTLSWAEVKNWQNLCRCCLNDAETKVNFSSFIQIDENLIKAGDILASVGNIELSESAQLPTKFCNDCLNKLNKFYSFQLQIFKAEVVLKRMLSQLLLSTNGAAAKCEEKKTSKKIGCTANEQVTVDVFENEHVADSLPLLKSYEGTPECEVDDVEVHQLDDEAEYINELEEEYVEPMEAEISSIDSNAQENPEEMEEVFFIDDESWLEKNEETKTQTETANKEEDACDEIWLDNNEETKTHATENRELEEEETVAARIADADDIELEYDVEKLDEKDASFEEYIVEVKKSKQISLLDNFNCTICKQEFDMQRLLIDHVNQTHPGARAYKCRECDSAFTRVQSLSRHMLMHNNKAQKFNCENCNRCFLRRDDLTRHKRVHTGERPFPCPHCPKAFKQHGERNEHLLAHTKVKRFNCPHCPQRFSSRNGVYMHKKMHSCDKCETFFNKVSDFKSHACNTKETPKN